MSRSAAALGIVCLLGVGAAGCGSSGQGTTTSTAAQSPTPQDSLQACLTRKGYAVTPESPGEVETAPSRFKFTAVWNVLNPSRVALALTFSRDADGAKQAAAWTRTENSKLGRGAVRAPVVQFGKIDALWTATPGARDAKEVYGCIRGPA
jgi:hypothetical protein